MINLHIIYINQSEIKIYDRKIIYKKEFGELDREILIKKILMKTIQMPKKNKNKYKIL